MSEEIDELKDKRLCAQCIDETFLSGVVMQSGEVDDCAYCERLDRTLSIGEIAELVEVAFEQHFIRTSNEPDSWQSTLLSDRDSSYTWWREGEPVVDAIANAARIPQEAAEDIQQILEHEHGDFDNAAMGVEDEFDGESHYEERGVNADAWAAEWDAFERSLKTEARFFNQVASAHLASVFEGLDALETHDGRPLIVTAGPDQAVASLYRARVFQAEDPLLDALTRPDLHLGPPPARLAAAGRMNPRGISVFYGASDAPTAIAEVRPPVGSRVAVAQFEIIRSLRLLDLTALNAVSATGSVFDPSYASRLERMVFLQSLSGRITRPVMPDDEALDYLSTQAVADFLATDAAGIDGIIFPSVQAAGDVVNAVLFQKASRVEAVEIPTDAKVSARSGDWYEEGFEVDYQVAIETAPVTPSEEVPEPDLDFGPMTFSEPWRPPDPDRREPTLRIRLESLEVHYVSRVSFETSSHRVRRSTHEQWRPGLGGSPF